MDRNIWETIANQCAPVLMDVKPSNLLILTRAEEAAFRQMDEIEGISCICLHSGKKSTWLLYRKDRLEAAGLTIHQVLAENDAYHALDQADGLIRTGPTGTNVNDVAVVLIKR